MTGKRNITGLAVKRMPEKGRKKTRAAPKKKKSIPANRKTASFPIVGIGASAGGLEAYQKLLKYLSAKPGMAFVFIMHLAPEHKSMLTALLARFTKMPVREIKSGMTMEVNHVYIIPPSTNVSIAGGKLKLNKMKNAGLKRMPIDWFFRSLAQERGSRSIAVILSGTATDGTLGAEAIKAEGGITFAQDAKSAKYGGMPQSAITAGCVDFVLSPKKIARELERIAKHPFISSAGLVKTDESIITSDKGLGSVFDILRSAKGLDFTHYKTATISRRISRRMVLLKLQNLKAYIKFLRENKGEVENLYEDLLLKVTGFFRDPKAFRALKKRVIPAILKNKTKGQEVRIWVPGCSTGEEAYSIAICLIEAMGNKASAIPVRIFATDVSESGIDKARRGVYGKNIRNDFTPEQLKKFFTKTDNSYKVSKLLREMCIFSKQNVFSDPPFSNVDLISCRNLIIYLQSVLQKEVFHKFHYALRPGGFLLLGNSESVGSHSNLFKMLDKKQRIFVKKYLSTEPKIELSRNYYPPNRLEIKTKPDAIKSKEADIESIIERTVLGEYAPCGVLIDSDMEVVQFRGHTGRFLESPTGKPSLSISKLAAKGLFLPLRAAICKARQTKRTVKREAPDVSYNGSRMRVSITVIPVKSGPLKEEFFLVLFDEIKGKAAAKKLPKTRSKSVKGEKYVESLQKELSETKEYLQSIIEEQENANEEVKTANEEILSSNEELLSTNEELETAKEELQSSNEELITTNEELQNRNKEVILLNNDLINLLNSINMPVIMMGTDLCVRRITPQAEKVLNVIPSDIGRPISKIKLNIDIPDLEKTLSDVIESLQPKTFEIKSKEGNWYSVYIRPYRTLDNQINGVVAIFVDITERKKTQQVIEKARNYAENILETMREPLIVLDTDLKVISANRSFYRTFKVTPEQTKGRFIYDLGNRQWDIPKLRHLLEELLLKNIAIDNYEIEHDFETIGPKAMLFNARRLADMQMVLITIEDITERKKASEALRASEERNRLVLEATMDGFWVVDMQHRFLDVNDVYCRMSGYTKQELLNMSISDVEAIETPAETDAHFQKFIEIGNDRFESRHRRKDGSVFDVEISVQYRPDEGGKLVVFLHDITEQKRAERELARAKDEEFKAIFDNAVDGFVIVDMKTKKFYMANNAMCRMLGYSLEEFKKLVVRDIHPEKDTPYVINQFEKQAKGEISFAADMPVKRKDGSVFYADINASPVIIAGKKYLMGSFRDITERKQMDENTRHMEEMKTTSEIKTKFTSMVSHELRSPLGSIKEGINLVLEGLAGDINEEQRDLLDTAKRNTDRLGRLINNVLDFQKMDSGKIDFDIRENDINEIAGEVNKAMFLLAKEKGLDLAVDLDDSIPMVKFDRDKIVEVLTNLMSNAIKYTERGIITISTKLEDNTVHVIVRDTGRGIEAKDIQRLFQAFEQLDGAKDKKKGGTGLGLAISKEIILAHKGKIWVESEVDKGSSFHFVLPLKMRRKADFCG